jgi:iron complex outermembrane receptor protein
MYRNNRLSLAVSIAMSASFAGMASAAIEEVVVTATKVSSSTQDIAVKVSAITSEKLDQMGVSNFEDYLIQLPGVTAGGSGPGQNTIYIRGIASTTPAISIAGVAGLAPNVAFYLDEQPLAQPGRNLDVYAADLNRVEVLAGPQGTLFGASSQAGTVRLITNKPDPSAAYGKLKMGVSTMKEGGSNNNFEAMYNLPVNDKLTIRGVVYSDDKGGYIDNVQGTRTVQESARFRKEGFVRSNGVAVSSARTGFQAGAGYIDADGDGYSDLPGVTFLAADNADLVEEDFNTSKYTGARVSALISLNDNWELLLAHTTQKLDADGVFFADPNLGDLETQSYIDDSLTDEFDNTSWTLTGRIANLDIVYTGAYTERTADQNIGYSDYMFVGQYLPYYTCDYSVTYTARTTDTNGDGVINSDDDRDPTAATGTCQGPNLSVPSYTTTEVSTHEIRITTPQDQRTRLTAGAFISDTELQERASFTYPGSTLVQGWNAAGGLGFNPANFSYDDGHLSSTDAYAPGEIFRNDIKRTDKNYGVFGELSYDVSDDLSVTLGARYYDIEVDFDGSAKGSFGQFCGNAATCVDNRSGGTNIGDLYDGDGIYKGEAVEGIPDAATSSGTIFKFTASYTPSADVLLYATVSEGFRAGFLNRPGGYTSKDGLYTVPYEFGSDDLTNYEFGWKADLMDGTLRINGSVFIAEIDGLQTTIFDPSIANLFFSDNAANAEVKGLETDIIWAPASAEGLTVSAGLSVLDTEITDTLTTSTDVVTGDSLAFAPELQANVQARYEWQMSGMTAHIMPHLAYSDESYSDIVRINRDLMASWTMLGLTAGVTTDTWGAELFIDNLTDERAELARNYINDRERVSYSRPRTMGVRMTYNF